jgi:hypothetical protein
VRTANTCVIRAEGIPSFQSDKKSHGHGETESACGVSKYLEMYFEIGFSNATRVTHKHCSHPNNKVQNNGVGCITKHHSATKRRSWQVSCSSHRGTRVRTHQAPAHNPVKVLALEHGHQVLGGDAEPQLARPPRGHVVDDAIPRWASLPWRHYREQDGARSARGQGVTKAGRGAHNVSSSSKFIYIYIHSMQHAIMCSHLHQGPVEPGEP